MPPCAAPRSPTLPWLRLGIAGAICGLLSGSPLPGRAAAQPADGGIPADLARDEVRCDAAGCALGGCILQQVERNPARLLGKARLLVEAAAGRLRGFRLVGLTPGSLLARIGLQDDDVVLAVSSYELGSPESAQAALNRLRSADSETILLERGGQKLTRVLRFDRRPLAATDCPLPPPSATEREGSVAAAAPTSPPAPATSDAETLRAITRDIRCANTRCTLRRATVDLILSNATLVSRSVRVVPAFKDGQPQGLKLFAIRPGSLFAVLGMRNGDLLRSLSGFDLSTPDNALRAYATLRDADEVKLELDRSGARTVLTYVIKK